MCIINANSFTHPRVFTDVWVEDTFAVLVEVLVIGSRIDLIIDTLSDV